jgi:hypothetical protein
MPLLYFQVTTRKRALETQTGNPSKIVRPGPAFISIDEEEEEEEEQVTFIFAFEYFRIRSHCFSYQFFLFAGYRTNHNPATN